MKILVANDDGIAAPGIIALAKRLSMDEKNEVYVVAPDRERSATGHSLTLHKPLRVKDETMPGNVKMAWSTTGTPADSVKLAISVLLESKPDLIISGINNGANMGTELLYSGTVAAAMVGTLSNIPSMAVSMVREGREAKFDDAAEFIYQFLDSYDITEFSPRILININIPSIAFDQYKGVAITELGQRDYNDWFEHRKDPRGGNYYWLAGHAIKDGEKETSDATACHQDKVSITPVSFQMTDFEALEKLDKMSSIRNILNKGKTS